jgi:glucose/arabinose dehydrogenase
LAVLAIALGACTAASPSPSASFEASSQPSPSEALPSPSSVGEPSELPLPSGPDHLTLEPVASGLRDPIGIAFPPDGSGRLAIVERGGTIRWVAADRTVVAAPLLDISGLVVADGEQGLLGLAFHPDFATNGRFFVDYTRRIDGATVVAEYIADSNRATASAASARILITQDQPAPNHNGGDLAFGPDGYLYIGFGDGGGGGDTFHNGQNPNTLLAKILRIDVDGAPAPNKAYAIPATNPFVTGGGVPETWVWGLRNPWQFSFDRDWGDLYIGDVGQDRWEEIDREPANDPGGENYGWPILEATHCFKVDPCTDPNLVGPIAEYSHALGCAVIGGYVYRGAAQPDLVGTYVFGDTCSGRLFTLQVDQGTEDPKVVLDSGPEMSSFGEDEAGEVYVVALNGTLSRVVVAP